MNNQDFRKLFDRPSAGSPGTNNSSTNASRTPASSLGSRMRSSIPMTPRTVKGGAAIDFQRQLADQRAGSQPATKKFRSSAAPKGARLAAGYTDRTQNRVDEEDDADDRAKRIKALEESMKLGQIDQDTFEKLRDEITGGDVSATHLVKGLDRRLLERVRRGEDVLGVGSGSKAAEKEPEPDVDDEFEQLERRDVAPVVKEKKEKKGETALAGTKRTRNEILAELKAQRQAAAAAKAAAQPQLGSKFRRLGAHQAEAYPRIEIDERGREVLLTLDEDGHVKRKVRKIKAEAEVEEKESSLPMPDPKAKPLGMEVPELPKEEEKEEDDDIFEGVGDDYDPLAGLGDDDSSSEEEDGELTAPAKSESPSHEPSKQSSPGSEALDSATMPPPPKPTVIGSIPKTNYFNDSSPASSSSAQPPSNPLTDPTILAAIRKAKEIDPERLKADDDSASAKDPAEEARLKKRAAMLAAQDRDLEDMDMGFGSSRFDDAEEMEEEGTKIKLSEWKGMGGGDDDDDDGGRERGGKKRKRGPKKRKGDKDSAADVLKTMERMKDAGK
ncbi:hypothetical protein IWZ03DRAFT_384719 [Phyllosticta citriasiana]|uniref:RED-like N-terminal domain-containing protein n=1 Tax=Phyllosticta citriasiana TaxID=595635 RepID=A0ABR1KGL6_9PEZI